MSPEDAEKLLDTAIKADDVDETMRLGAILDKADTERYNRLAATTLGDVALWYAEQGIAVFPLQPRGKLPATRHGFKDATTDRQQVLDWWRAMPGANIGAPTGHRFDVFDIDGVEGVQSWIGFHDELAGLTIGHVSTPRPGGNHIYVPPAGQGNRAAIHPGIDYRGLGGYVVVPPSVGTDGNTYRWIRPLDTEAA